MAPQPNKQIEALLFARDFYTKMFGFPAGTKFEQHHSDAHRMMLLIEEALAEAGH